MDRKSFIAVCGTGAVAALLASCGKAYYATNTVTNNKVTVELSEFDFEKNGAVAKRPFVLVQNNQLDYPLVVYKNEKGEYTALYMQCSHSGCELKAGPTVLVCPCHGSEFSTEGKVLSPPADKDLVKFPVQVSNNQLIIDLNTQKL